MHLHINPGPTYYNRIALFNEQTILYSFNGRKPFKYWHGNGKFVHLNTGYLQTVSNYAIWNYAVQ